MLCSLCRLPVHLDSLYRDVLHQLCSLHGQWRQGRGILVDLLQALLPAEFAEVSDISRHLLGRSQLGVVAALQRPHR